MRVVLVQTVLAFGALAQQPSAAPEQGQAMYRSNCAFCHGLTGLGGRGPDLVTRPRSDAEIKTVIREGVPGTTMPSFGGFDEPELDRLVVFIRHLSGGAKPGEKATGDPARGRQIYAKNACASCHQIGSDGSTYGPELTRIGGARPLHYLRESMIEPSADISPQYEGVTVVTAAGQRVRGVRINEDSFTLQLRVPSQQFRSFVKHEAKEIVAEKESLMPSYAKMPKADLDDLIAYLATLRSDVFGGGKVKQAEGIR